MIYYIQTNLIAIFLSILMLIQGIRTASRRETSQILFDGILKVIVMMGLSDIAAYVLRGRMFPLAGACLQMSNIIYFVSVALSAYLWFLYVYVRMERAASIRRLVLVTGLPMALLMAGFLLNPVTGFFFTLDETNLYHRGPGVLLTWLVEGMYMIIACAVTVRHSLKQKSRNKRQENRVYLLFVLPMIVAAVAQMLFYGSTTVQMGLTLAMLMVYLNTRMNQIRQDELTGLNNRNALFAYAELLATKQKPGTQTVFMMDLDRFKSINDTYGHLEGDRALCTAADVLRAAAGEFTRRRLILFRYGGDEFVMVGSDMSDAEIAKVAESISECVGQRNRADNVPYRISLSVGIATAVCHDADDFEELLGRADAEMYRRKREKDKGRKRG